MGAPSRRQPFLQVFQYASVIEILTDHAKGHPLRKTQMDGSPIAPQNKRKLQMCRWDSSTPGCNTSMPSMPTKSSCNSPPSLKRMMSPPPGCSLHNVLKPVRRDSFDSLDQHLDDICGLKTEKNMSTADLLATVLGDLDLLDEENESSVYEKLFETPAPHQPSVC